jgi:protein involved in polysaccharide export with SLBB domain
MNPRLSIALLALTLASCQPTTPTTPNPPTTASYTLTGDVPRPGKRPLPPSESVVSALVDAGFNHDTLPWPAQVSLSRPAKNGNPKATAVINVREMLQSGNMSQNYLLEPGDVLYVPSKR